ncbi:MAG TPA: ABC transporter permease [Polyangiaceae bacterium]|nr:ABC transporter permease [Polyangiaceae bacterium]
MTKSLLVARREMHAYLRSPLGAVIIAAMLLIDGILFYWKGLTEALLSSQVLEEFFWAASGTTMIAAVLLSMRLIAEERQTGSFTLLNTSPIRDREIVLGKFLSVVGMIALMTLLTIYMPLLIFVNGKVSVGHIAVGYAGLLLLGASVAAIGLFASALTRSQVVAGIVGAAVTGALLLLWIVARAVDPPLNEFLSAVALHHNNFRPFMLGTLELGPVVYYIAVTYFFLLAATKVLEARRWR